MVKHIRFDTSDSFPVALTLALICVIYRRNVLRHKAVSAKRFTEMAFYHISRK